MIQVKVDRLRAAMKAIDEVVEKRSTVPILYVLMPMRV